MSCGLKLKKGWWSKAAIGPNGEWSMVNGESSTILLLPLLVF
jgi:hypothetical protein